MDDPELESDDETKVGVREKREGGEKCKGRLIIKPRCHAGVRMVSKKEADGGRGRRVRMGVGVWFPDARPGQVVDDGGGGGGGDRRKKRRGKDHLKGTENGEKKLSRGDDHCTGAEQEVWCRDGCTQRSRGSILDGTNVSLRKTYRTQTEAGGSVRAQREHGDSDGTADEVP